VEQEQNNNILLEVARCLWKHIFGMFVLFTSIMLVTIITTYTQTPIYQTEARVLVKFGREYIYRSVEERTDGNVRPQIRFDPDEIIANEVEIFKSSELAEEVVIALGVEMLFPDMGQKVDDKDTALSLAVNSFLKMVDVLHLKGSNVLSVSCQHSDPKVAVLVVDDIIERFKVRHVEIYKNPQLSFLEKQAAEFAIELQAVEEAKRKYKKENGIIALDQQREIAMRHFANVNELLIEAKAATADFLKQKNYLELQLGSIDELVVQSKEVRERGNVEFAELKLLELKRELSHLNSVYTSDNRRIISLANQIRITEQFLVGMESTTLQTVQTGKSEHFLLLQRKYIDVVASYEGQVSKVESISQQVAVLEEKLQRLSEQEIDIKRLDDTIESADKNYQQYHDFLVGSRVQELMDSEKLINVVVVDKARVPLKPIKPRKKLRVLVGLILAVASCFFYSLFREYIWVSEK